MRLKLEICRTIAALSSFNFELLLSDNGSTLLISSNLLVQAIAEEDSDIKLQGVAGRALFDLGTALAKHLEEPGWLFIYIYFSNCHCEFLLEHSYNLKDGLTMWSNIIKNSITRLSTDPNPIIRSVVCDILSSIGPLVYENLEVRLLKILLFVL